MGGGKILWEVLPSIEKDIFYESGEMRIYENKHDQRSNTSNSNDVPVSSLHHTNVLLLVAIPKKI